MKDEDYNENDGENEKEKTKDKEKKENNLIMYLSDDESEDEFNVKTLKKKLIPYKE